MFRRFRPGILVILEIAEKSLEGLLCLPLSVSFGCSNPLFRILCDRFLEHVDQRPIAAKQHGRFTGHTARHARKNEVQTEKSLA